MVIDVAHNCFLNIHSIEIINCDNNQYSEHSDKYIKTK